MISPFLAPAGQILFRWLISFINLEFDLETRTLRASLIRVDLGPPRKQDTDGSKPTES